MSCEKELSGELSSYPVSPLIKAGHSVAIINYTRAPKQNLQDMQTQVKILFLFSCILSAYFFMEKNRWKERVPG